MGKRNIVQTVIGAVVTTAGVLTGQAWLASIGISMVAGGILGALAPKSLRAQQQHMLSNGQGPNNAIPVIYGTSRVGVIWTDLRTDDDTTLYAVGTICLGSEGGTGVEDITAVYFDNEPVIAGPSIVKDGTLTNTAVIADYDDHLEYAIHLGTDAQTVDAALTSTFPTEYPSTSTATGVAYIVLKLTYDEDVYPAGLPTVTVGVKGQKLYDPRDASTAWSTNPALAVLDYLTSTKYGCGVDLSEIDTESFEDAANYCDETVNTTAYNAARFTCNGILDTSGGRQSNLAGLLSACRGDLVYQSGTFRIIIRQPQAAETFALTEDNIVGDWEFVRTGEVPNSVTVSFVDPSIEYQVREVTWPEAGQANGFLGADNSIPANAKIDLPFTTNSYIAQQIGMVALRESREDVTVAVTAKEEALKLQVGDVVNLTHSTPGWTEKAFWVVSVGILPNAEVRLVLREYSVDAYTLDTQDTEATVPGTDIPELILPPDTRILSCDPIRETSGGASLAYRVVCGDSVDSVFVYEVLLEQPVILADPWDYAEEFSIGLQVLTPDANGVIEVTFDVPARGFSRYAIFRPYHQRRSGVWLPGHAWNLHIDPVPPIPPILDTDDAENTTTAYLFATVQERGVPITSVTFGYQVGDRGAPVEDVAATRGPGDTSQYTGQVLGENEYEFRITKAQGQPTWLWARATDEDGVTERSDPIMFGVHARPYFAGNGPTVVGSVIFLNGNNYRAASITRTDGGGTWTVAADGITAVDVAALDDSGNAGLSGAIGTYTVSLLADTIADSGITTLSVEADVVVNMTGSAAANRLTQMTVAAPSVGTTTASVTLCASDSAPSIETEMQYSVNGGEYTAWATIAGASPASAPTTATAYNLPGLPTARELTGALDPPQYPVNVRVKSRLYSGATTYDVKQREFGYTTNADDV